MRFTVLALLTLKFGPDIVRITGEIFRQHFSWVLAAVAMGLVIWLVVRRTRGKSKALTAEIAENAERK